MNGGVGERPLPNPGGGILGVSQQTEALPQSEVSAIHLAGGDHVIQAIKVETDKKTPEVTHSRQVAATITKSSTEPIHVSGTSLAGKASAVIQEGHLHAMGARAVVLGARVQAVAGPVLSEKEKILQEGMQKLQSALQNLLAFDPLNPLNPAPTNIQNRMKELCVPGVGIAVIHKGVVIPLGFGELTNTKLLSQAASDSKTIAALTVLSLVDEGILNLEDDVGEILGPDLWARIDTDKLTIDELDQEGRVVGEKKPKVTILNLLSHTAETNIGGFGGYDKEGERKIPTTVDEILEEVRLLSKPDIQHHEYSGGGYEILRKIIELKVGSYEKAVQARVFDKLGMKESTYRPQEGAATANGNDPQGRPLPGGSFAYPQLAAAGLWTTPEELAQVVIGIQQACEQDGGIISQATAKEMLTSRTVDKPNGLGVFVEAMKNSTVFFHPGANAGFQNIMVGNNKGQGAVVMTNSDYGGKPMWKEGLAAIAKEFEWPDHESLTMCQPLFSPDEVSSIDQDAWGANYAGTYACQHGDKVAKIMILQAEGKIFLQEVAELGKDHEPRIEITPLGPNLGCFREFDPGPCKVLRLKNDDEGRPFTLEVFDDEWKKFGA